MTGNRAARVPERQLFGNSRLKQGEIDSVPYGSITFDRGAAEGWVLWAVKEKARLGRALTSVHNRIGEFDVAYKKQPKTPLSAPPQRGG